MDTDAKAPMTKGDRDELARLIRQRERIAKTDAATQAAELRADFERQLGRNAAGARAEL